VKSVLTLALLVVAGMIAGCSNKKSPSSSQNSLVDVAPPPPQPVQTAVFTASPPVTSVYDAPPPEPATPATPSRRTYVVKRGDTLWGIAQRTYGDGRQYKRILAANPSIKGDRLLAGQTIVLP